MQVISSRCQQSQSTLHHVSLDVTEKYFRKVCGNFSILLLEPILPSSDCGVSCSSYHPLNDIGFSKSHKTYSDFFVFQCPALQTLPGQEWVNCWSQWHILSSYDPAFSFSPEKAAKNLTTFYISVSKCLRLRLWHVRWQAYLIKGMGKTNGERSKKENFLELCLNFACFWTCSKVCCSGLQGDKAQRHALPAGWLKAERFFAQKHLQIQSRTAYPPSTFKSTSRKKHCYKGASSCFLKQSPCPYLTLNSKGNWAASLLRSQRQAMAVGLEVRFNIRQRSSWGVVWNHKHLGHTQGTYYTHVWLVK